MKKILVSIALSTSLFINTANANLPVFDFNGLAQDILSYTEQIKDIMMYEKELEALGVEFGKINSFINKLQDGWNEINNMKDTVSTLTALNNLFNKIDDDCNALAQTSKIFKDAVETNKDNFRDLGVDIAKTKACKMII